jgi:hypothetical protein
MRRLVMLLVLAGLVLAASVALAQPEAVTLEFKGKPGTALVYNNTVNFQMELTMPNPGGGSEPLVLTPAIRGSARTQMLVKEVAENGDLTLGTKVDSFNGSVDVADFHLRLGLYGSAGGGQQGGYRSGRDSRGLTPAELFKLPELPVQTVMDKHGKLLSIQGFERLIPPIPGPGGKPLDFGAYLKKLIDQFSVPAFPEGPVAVGEQWVTKLEVDPAQMVAALGVPLPPQAEQQMAAMKFPIAITSTLVGLEPVNGVECAKIEKASPWELTMPMSPPGGQGPSLTSVQSGKTMVTIWFDPVAGQVVRQTLDFSQEMKVAMGETPMVQMTMKGTAQNDLVP